MKKTTQFGTRETKDGKKQIIEKLEPTKDQ
jgi:hypothetical protein